MTDTDPFAEAMPRDQWGRPLIIPAGRNGKPNPNGKPAAYLRASTIAKVFDTGGGLAKWQTRHAVIGVAISPDLAAMVAAMGRNLNGYSATDKRDLDAIIERAHDRSGGNEKADYGTAVHALTEPDRDPFALDPVMSRDVAAYDLLLERLDVEVVTSEVFVVNDGVKVAGTYDHSYRFRSGLTYHGEQIIAPGGIVCGDKKTGSLHLGQHAIQLAIYARGATYDPATGERGALDMSPQWGVVVHVPKGQGRAALYPVDLAAGWKAAKLAVEAYAYTRANDRKVSPAVEVSVDDEPAAVDTAPPAAIEAPAPVEVVEAEVVEAEVVEPAATEAPSPADIPRDQFGDPAADPDWTAADAIAALHRAGLNPVDVIDRDIDAAESQEACRLLWAKYHHEGRWTDRHTARVKARLAALNVVAA